MAQVSVFPRLVPDSDAVFVPDSARRPARRVFSARSGGIFGRGHARVLSAADQRAERRAPVVSGIFDVARRLRRRRVRAGVHAGDSVPRRPALDQRDPAFRPRRRFVRPAQDPPRSRAENRRRRTGTVRRTAAKPVRRTGRAEAGRSARKRAGSTFAETRRRETARQTVAPEIHQGTARIRQKLSFAEA